MSKRDWAYVLSCMGHATNGYWQTETARGIAAMLGAVLHAAAGALETLAEGDDEA